MLRSEAWVWLARGAGATVGVIIVASIAAVVMGASNVLVQVGIAILLASGLEPMVTWRRETTGLARIRRPHDQACGHQEGGTRRCQEVAQMARAGNGRLRLDVLTHTR